MKKILTTNFSFFLCILVSIFFSNRVFANVFGLQNVLQTHTRIGPYNQALSTGYVPIYKMTITGQAGDILRATGQVENSEENNSRNKIYAYLSVRPSSSQTRQRISSYTGQIVNHDGNHHMPLNLFAYYLISSNDTYIVEIMAKKVFSSTVNVESFGDTDLTDDIGQLIVEQYHSYTTKSSAVSTGAKFVVDMDRAPILNQDVTISPGVNDPYWLPATKTFSLASGDILRAQGLASAEYIIDQINHPNRAELFGLHLYLDGDVFQRLSVSTENLNKWLFRFSHQNDGYYQAATSEFLKLTQKADRASSDPTGIVLKNGQSDLIALQFSNNVNGSYLLSSQRMTSTSDINFNPNTWTQLFTYTGQHQANDILRVDSHILLEMTSGNAAASCLGRIEIYENSVLQYSSVVDQRYIRNSTTQVQDIDSAALSPFALHKLLSSGQYEVRLTVTCNSSGTATIQSIGDGRDLIIDQFRN